MVESGVLELERPTTAGNCVTREYSREGISDLGGRAELRMEITRHTHGLKMVAAELGSA